MFNGLAKLLSVGFIGSIDRRAERGSANGSKSSQHRVDPGDVDATGLQNKVCSVLSGSFCPASLWWFFCVCESTVTVTFCTNTRL